MLRAGVLCPARRHLQPALPVSKRLLSTSRRVLVSVHQLGDKMPPLQTPAWYDWRMNVPSATPSDSRMLRNQGEDKLPRLPVPKLEDTLARLERSCEPLVQDDAQRRELHRKVQAFGRPGGVGAKLQQLLERKRDEPGVRNWLARDWDEQVRFSRSSSRRRS